MLPVPKLTGSVSCGLLISHSVLCNLTNTNAGTAITGVEFNTRLNAVSPTASVAAFLLFPRLCTSFPLPSLCIFSSSLNTGYTSIPFRISSPRIKKTFNAPADATAANGTRRVKTVLVPGESRLRRGTSALRPRATEHEAETARK